MSGISSAGSSYDVRSSASILAQTQAQTKRADKVSLEDASNEQAVLSASSSSIVTMRSLLGETNAKVAVSMDGDVLEISRKSVEQANLAAMEKADSSAVPGTSTMIIATGGTPASGGAAGSGQAAGGVQAAGPASGGRAAGPAGGGRAAGPAGGGKATGTAGAEKSSGASETASTEEEEDETDLSGYSEMQLSQMLAGGTITSAQYITELNRRKEAELTEAESTEAQLTEATAPAKALSSFL